MTIFANIDFYTDPDVHDDPHPYFHYLRSQGPVVALPGRNAVAVTGFQEAIEVMLDAEHFSSFNAILGAMLELPIDLGGDDITDQVHALVGKIPYTDQLINADGKRHADMRAILARLFTPTRLKSLHEKLFKTADEMIDEFIDEGRVELVSQFGAPYALLIIADLLGLSLAERKRIREISGSGAAVGVGAQMQDVAQDFDNPLVKIGMELFKLIAERRAKHQVVSSSDSERKGFREDILTDLALARYPDGSEPDLVTIAGLAGLLFGAGQDTTTLQIASAFRVLATKPDLQQELREDRAKIPAFVEEILRFESSVKSAGRVCVKTQTVGSVEIKAGTYILLTHMGANRDPRRFDDPDEFRMARPRVKEHLAFGRGPHTCIGATLARAELAASIEKLLARLGNIRLSEKQLDASGSPVFRYVLTYILRKMKELHLEFDKVA